VSDRSPAAATTAKLINAGCDNYVCCPRNSDNYVWCPRNSQLVEASTALAALEEARAILQKLSDAAPQGSSYRDDLAGSLTDIGDVSRATGQAAEVQASYQRAIAIREALVKSYTETVAYRSGLASSLRRFGLVQRTSEAVASWWRAVALHDSLPTLSVTDRFELASCRAALSGVAGRDGSRVSAAEGPVEADRAMSLLRRAFADRYRNADALRVEMAFDPLLTRPDFQALLADLAFPSDPFAKVTDADR
jgi:hypothetical protein